MEATQVIRLFAAIFSLLTLLPYRPAAFIENHVSEAMVKESDAKAPTVKRALSSSATWAMALVSQSISKTDCLSVLCKSVRLGVEEERKRLCGWGGEQDRGGLQHTTC